MYICEGDAAGLNYQIYYLKSQLDFGTQNQTQLLDYRFWPFQTSVQITLGYQKFLHGLGLQEVTS